MAWARKAIRSRSGLVTSGSTMFGWVIQPTSFYLKKKADSPAEKITLVRINVEPTMANGRKVYAITRQWESGDEVVHTSRTLHDANDFSTVFHETWWKRLGYRQLLISPLNGWTSKAH